MARTLRPLAASVVLAAALLVAGLHTRLTAGPAPAPADQALDLGPTAAVETVSASLVLKVRNPEALETFVALTEDPNLPLFHRFLSLRDSNR